MKTERRIWGQYVTLSNKPKIEIIGLEEQKAISHDLLRSTQGDPDPSQNYLQLRNKRGKGKRK